MPTSQKRHHRTQKVAAFASGGSGIPELEKLGVSRFEWSDPYHLALTATWPQFFLGILVVYLLTNLVFALLYWAAPGSVANLPPGALMDAFFFSLETLATVGYGYMAPITRYSHVVSAIEIFVGLVLTATMTGLIFVRFSKPRAKILFASHAVVSRSKGVPTLMVRVGNGRLYSLEENRVRMTILRPMVNAFAAWLTSKWRAMRCHFSPWFGRSPTSSAMTVRWCICVP